MSTWEWLSPAQGDVALIAWRLHDAPRATAVVKLTCALEPGSTARFVTADELVHKERHYDKDPARSVEAPPDVAPWKPRVDVTLQGHATAPAGRTLEAAAVRLAVHGASGSLLDRTLHVYGDREGAGRPKPFARLPLVWERAAGGPGTDNPVGRAPGGLAPNLIDPGQPTGPACFAPLSRYWPEARRQLGSAKRKDLDAASPSVPAGFTGEYFQVAPSEQRLASLRGDEWLVLDGVHAALARVQSRLPGEVVHAVAYDGAGRAARLRVVLDALLVDADRLTASLVFRAGIDLAATSFEQLHVAVALARPEQAPAWPDARGLAARTAPTPSAPRVAPSPPAPEELGETRAFDPALPSDPLPFRPAAPALEPPASRRDVGSTSFAEELPPPSRALPFASLAPPSRPLPPPPPSAPVLPASPEEDPFTSTRLVLSAPSEPALPFALPSSTAAAKAEAPSASWPAVDDEERTVLGALPGSSALPFGAEPVVGGQTVGAQMFEPSAAVAPPFSAAPPPVPGRLPPARLPLVTPPPAAPPPSPPASPPPAAGLRPPRAPKRRDGAVLPVFARPPLAVATLAWQVTPPRDSLTVVVKGTFRLVPEGPAAPADEVQLCTGDVFTAEEPQAALVTPSDFAVLKRRADVTLLGHAHAPKDARGRAMTAAQVELRFGEGKRGFTRRVAVFGDRVWKRGLVTSPGEPAPFDKIPLSWQRAWGGPGSPKNPAGTGYKAVNGPDGVARMPNLEDPSSLVTSPTASAEPACLGAIAPLWRERWSLLGTYDRAWLETRWPYFPADFDWGFFQHAPAQQQVEHLHGDESFSITGASREHPRLDGSLPGLRARAFFEPAPGAPHAFREVKLVLDTATFDMDTLLLTLVWRGLAEVSEPEAPEIGAVFAMLEPLADAPKTLDEARAAYVALATPLEPAAPSPPAANDGAAPPPPEALPEENPEEDLGALREKELLAELGLPDEPAPALTPAPPEQLAASLAAVGVDASDIDALLAALKGPTSELPEAKPPEPDARARVEAAVRAGQALDGARLAGVDLSGLDLSGVSLARADLRRARLVGSKLDGAKLDGSILAEADLTDASLVGASLRGVYAVRSKLTRADLAKATLDGANLEACDGEGSRFDEATGKACRLVAASLPRSSFDRAKLAALDLSGALLEDASLEDAELPEVRLYGATAPRAKLTRARLPGARAEGVNLEAASLAGLVAPRSTWESARLAGASFLGAELAGASFSRAQLSRAVFSKADLREARFRRADLAGAGFLLADLAMADFERATLEDADLRGACLHEAETWKAKLSGAKLDQALVTGTKLARKA